MKKMVRYTRKSHRYLGFAVYKSLCMLGLCLCFSRFAFRLGMDLMESSMEIPNVLYGTNVLQNNKAFTLVIFSGVF